MSKNSGFFTYIKLGVIVAAAGVGAGDLNSSAFAGIKLGVGILWAVIVGALLKFTLNEGIIRYQIASNQTWLEGILHNKYLRKPSIIIFGLYLIIWSFLVAAALISACGVVMHTILPIFNPLYDKIFYGTLLSIIAVAIIQYGNFIIVRRGF